MIRHIVFFSAKNKADIQRITDGLRQLETIAEPLVFEVSQNNRTDDLGNQVDVVVYAEFTDQAALDAYKNHPIYQKTIDIVRPLRDLRIAADISSGR